VVDLTGLMRESTVAKAFQWIDTHVDRIVEEAIRLCEIPAPTFEEAERAAYVQGRFQALGLHDVAIDAAGNVRGRRPGVGASPGVAVGAHLDTVFPRETDVRVRREGTRLHAPGIGDNSVAVASLLAMVEALKKPGFSFIEIVAPCPTIFERQQKMGDGLDRLRWYCDNSDIRNNAATKGLDIRLHDRIVVGKFVDIERPTYLDGMNAHYQERLGTKYKVYEG